MPRPTQPLLSTQNITDAALQSVEETGDFSMLGIAKRLNVTASSLYTHVSGRDRIVELMRIRIMSSIAVPEPPAGWSERVRAWGWAYRRTIAANWRLIPLLIAHTERTDIVFDIDNALFQAFTEGGFSPVDARHAISTLDSLVVGSVLRLATPDVAWTEPPTHPPGITDDRRTNSPVRPDETFEFGLRTLIAGWTARHLLRLLTEQHSDTEITSP
ncbi:AcrR family transcriptional regulator [Rhodococcus sp. 27YEA15]|uniref:TetR/AcrR family transcriptional regulator n=1 Tax=Rhodococcus sp. 27YEA15 TaxID=3156259 RepID=UPI003C7C3D8E